MYRTGIVLKQISSHKVAILDKDVGRINGISVKPICIGSLLHYTIEKEYGTLVYLAHWNVIDLPFALARDDILFWHHVLELCFYFIPLGSYTMQLFELCMFLYTVDTNMYWTLQTKKLYLFKLLITIGVYPQLPRLSSDKLHYFISVPLSAINQEIEEQDIKNLDEWLRVCIGDHPAIAQFKTIHYLITE